MIDVLIDSILDVAKLLPFLFLTYLFMEWMEHNTSEKMEQYLEKNQRLAPLAGALFGLLPECGFSTAASNLYATGIISAGTLIAVFLSTSDEMLPLMVSQRASLQIILPILLVKFVVAVVAGYIAERFVKHNHPHIDDFCEREHCDCENESVVKAAFEHTLKIAIWLFVVTLILNGLMAWFGESFLASLVTMHPHASILTCILIGLIPNCASSILLTTLYLEHAISFAAVCAGLLVNAGVGLMVLFRVNPNWKDNLKICAYLIVVAYCTGTILSFF